MNGKDKPKRSAQWQGLELYKKNKEAQSMRNSKAYVGSGQHPKEEERKKEKEIVKSF